MLLLQRRRRPLRRGSTILEFGLIYTLFLFVLIATIDFGQVLFMHQTLTERARAAIRYGATRPFNDATIAEIQNMVLFGSTVGSDSTGTFGVSRSSVEVTRAIGGVGLPDRLTVSVNGYRFVFFTPLIAGQQTGKPIVITLPIETP